MRIFIHDTFFLTSIGSPTTEVYKRDKYLMHNSRKPTYLLRCDPALTERGYSYQTNTELNSGV